MLVPTWFLACASVPPPATLVVAAEAGSTVFHQRLVVDLPREAAAWATCASPDDPEELHLAEASPATHHEIMVRGLLAGTRYTCTVHADGATGAVDFTTGDAPELPSLTVTGEGPISGAYTITNNQDGCFGADTWLLITDPEGRPRWAYGIGDGYVADIDAYLVDDHTVHYGGGWGLMSDAASNRGIFRDIDLDGQVLLERTVPDFGLGFNHHSEPLPDGTYVSLTGHLDTNGDRDWHGVGIEVWDPDAGVVWTWDSQEMYDAGLLFTPSPGDEDLPYHANAVDFATDAHGEAVWVSNYGMEQIWRLDRATGALTHVFGADGDLSLTDPADLPSVQHGIEVAGDHLLVYDNGQSVGRSRVVEYQFDLDARTAEVLWTWTESGWWDPIAGDVDYLPNGSVLVTQGFTQCVTPFSPDRSELVELVPPDTVAWRMTWDDPQWVVYRGERYDGCAVFANARYCPAVAERIAALEAE